MCGTTAGDGRAVHGPEQEVAEEALLTGGEAIQRRVDDEHAEQAVADLGPALGEHEMPGPPVVRVRLTFDQPEARQPVDHVGDIGRLARHAPGQLVLAVNLAHSRYPARLPAARPGHRKEATSSWAH